MLVPGTVDLSLCPVNSLVGVQSVFPSLVVTVLGWDEIVSWWGTVQSCLLFRYNNAEFSVGMLVPGTVNLSLCPVNSLIGIQSVLPFLVVTVLCWDEIVSWCLKRNGERFNLVIFDITMQSSLLAHGERFTLVFFDVTMQSSLLGWGKIQSWCNHAEFSVGMRHGSFLSFSISMQSSLLGWRTVQSCLLFRYTSLVGIQSVFPFLVITLHCWDEIVSWYLKWNVDMARFIVRCVQWRVWLGYTPFLLFWWSQFSVGMK